ncbi:MAG: hypothetical protein ACP5G2_02590 [Candidatus Bipolaricaulaceae bacterium]
MTATEALELACRMAGLREVPADSGVLVPGELGGRVVFAIDVGVGELLLARELGATGVVAHHPPGGTPRLSWHKVLWRHADLLEQYGVPREPARAAAAELVAELSAGDHAANYDHVPAAARALRLPLVGIHTPLDELGRRQLAGAVSHLPAGSRVGDLVARLSSLPELAVAATEVQVRVGAADNPAGHVAVFHGAGTNGGYPVAACAFRHGVDTVVYIHCSAAASRRLAAEFPDKNLVVTGHIAADSLGINPFLAELAGRGIDMLPLDVVAGTST